MGTLWNRSGTIERFADDLKAPGAQAFFFNGGTTTPLTVFRDAGEGSSFPHPVVADAYGRWPDVFVPFILSYDVLVKTAEGVQLTYTQNIPNPNPIDTTTIPPTADGLTTGMVHAELIDNVKPGFVRLNGKTIGSLLSPGTERNNDDTKNLFIYLYALPDSLAPVSGGRTGVPLNDFNNNKTITLPDCRGMGFMGIDTMGDVSNGTLNGVGFIVGSASQPASWMGSNRQFLTLAQMPAHTHGGTTAVESPTHSHSVTTGVESTGHVHGGTTDAETATHTHSVTSVSTAADHTHPQQSNTVIATGGSTGGVAGTPASATGGTTGLGGAHTHTVTLGTQSATHTHTFTTNTETGTHTHSFTTTDGAHQHSFTTDSQGSGAFFDNMPYMRLVTWFIKL